MAKDLVQIQDCFKDDGVVFLGLTPDSEAVAKAFARRHQVDWPIGWGAKRFIDENLGNRYPALLVIGRDGRVFWNDGAARLHHQHGEIAAKLFEHIENALKVVTSSP